MEKIKLTLKSNRHRRYFLGALLLIFLLTGIQLILSFSFFYSHYGSVIFSIAIILLLLFVKRDDRNDPRIKDNNISFAFLIIMLNWINWNQYWAAGLTLLILIFYSIAARNHEVIISGKEIIYPSFPQRRIQWNELQNILLKDDMLTIDFRNNKIIQQEIEGENEIDEKKINEFCRQQLQK